MEYWQIQAIDTLSVIPGYDPSYAIVYFNFWCGYEESGWLAILQRDGQHFVITGGYSVMSDCNDDVWQLDPITEEQAIAEMIEYDRICDDEAIG